MTVCVTFIITGIFDFSTHHKNRSFERLVLHLMISVNTFSFRIGEHIFTIEIKQKPKPYRMQLPLRYFVSLTFDRTPELFVVFPALAYYGNKNNACSACR